LPGPGVACTVGAIGVAAQAASIAANPAVTMTCPAVRPGNPVGHGTAASWCRAAMAEFPSIIVSLPESLTSLVSHVQGVQTKQH
jgi:hypothetical protein